MHYVIGDTHGHYTELMSLLEKLNITEEDVVVLVGDVTDRAESELEQKLLLEWCYEYITEDGPFQMVLGNHELDYLELIEAALKECNNDWTVVMREMLYFDKYRFVRCCNKVGLSMQEYYEFVKTLPLFKKFVINGRDYFVTHSWIKDENGKFAGYEGTPDICDSVWDRMESIYEYIDEAKGFSVIHGHTPVLCSDYFQINKRSEPYVVKNGCNINVDCALCYRKQVDGDLAAYCLETGDITYLYGEKDKCINVSPE